MARFKEQNYRQDTMVPISFDKQILPGTFEYSLTYLIEHELDLSAWDARYKNDEAGRPAYDPRVLLKIVLLAYSRGVTGSRKMARLCRENVLFMAISGDSHPHYTTLADFISSSSELIADLFVQVLLVCDAEGLIGRELFAIDGCKLPSNASKEWSGTKADLGKKKRKIDRAVRYLLNKHRNDDRSGADEGMEVAAKRQRAKLRATSRKIGKFLATHDERKGISGRTVQSNITDNESAKMKTSHGVIQGYTGVAAVDDKHQVIVHAEAHGQGQEHGLLEPSLEQAHANLGHSPKQQRAVKVVADSGYHNEKAVEYLQAHGIDGYVADTGFRSRDPRFATAKTHKPQARLQPKRRFRVEDFQADTKKGSCICPAGKAMGLKCKQARIGYHLFMQFQAQPEDCDVCPLRKQCLRHEKQRGARQVNIKLGITGERKAGILEAMKAKIDSPQGRHIYSKRLGTVEPVFGHIRETLGLRRFSYRGRKKVDGQWKLMAMIHNIFKIHRYGWEW